MIQFGDIKEILDGTVSLHNRDEITQLTQFMGRRILVGNTNGNR
jgi:molybdopterin/thiamine biosynthesis adenylyltransferase